MLKMYFSLIALFLVTSCSNEKSSIISEWRGPERSGIYPDTGLLDTWPEEGPEELWSINGIGNGYGSPVFAGDYFFITGETDSMIILSCYTLNGRELWKSTLGKEWIKTNPGSRSAPTIEGDLIYTVSGMGNIYCVSRHNGEIIWSRSFEDDARGIPTMHGFTEAPVIDDERVFWVPGGTLINAAALNRFTGEIIWSSEGFGERSGYNQGLLIKLPGRNIFVTFSAYHLMGFDSETGRMLWSQEQDNIPPGERKLGLGDTHSNSVIYSDGAIYYAAGDGNCGVKLSLSDNGAQITEVWRNKGFDSYMGGIVKIGDYIYGDGTARPGLKSINASTGKLIDSLRIGSGTVIAADNKLYYYSQQGSLYLVGFSEGKMKVLSSFRITKGTSQHFAHPVIYRGILYQRHGNTLMAFDIRER